MSTKLGPHPKEFRDDVVAGARRGESLVSQIANGERERRFDECGVPSWWGE